LEFLNTTIGARLTYNSRHFKDKEAVVYSDLGIRWNWQELNRQVKKVAKGLLALGVGKETHVAIWATNVPEWLLVQFAAAKIGAVLVTINPEWKQEEMRYALEQSDTEILVMIKGFQKPSAQTIYHYDYVTIINDLCPEISHCDALEPLQLKALPQLHRIIVIDQESSPGMVSWQHLLALGRDISETTLEVSETELSPHDTAMIQYTSGTTGFPKGTMLSHNNILNNARAAAEHMRLTCDDRLCGPVPYYHCFGSILVNLCSLVTGAAMVVPASNFDALKTLQAIERERCTAIHGVPTMFLMELDVLDLHKFDLRTLRTGIIAGAPVDKELMEAITQKMGANEMTIGYGLTEASPITHQTDPHDSIEKRIHSVGKPIVHTQSKIVDLNTFEMVEIGQVGEIWVKGYHVMQGYYNKPEETQKAIKDGWLRTGDLAKTDEDGYYYIVGRLKELIIVGGHNVYPAEVEQLLHSLLADKVEMLQVIGVPHPTLQEVVALVVKCHPGFSLSIDEVKERCSGKMEWPKIPRYLHLVKDFAPFMTVTGKIQKFKIKQYLTQKLQLG